LIEYYRVRASVASVSFALSNDGQILAENASVELRLLDVSQDLLLVEPGELPERPTVVDGPDHYIRSIRPRFGVDDGDLAVQRLPEQWQVTVHFGRIRPKETIWSRDLLWIGARSSRVLALSGRIYADNIPDPIPANDTSILR